MNGEVIPFDRAANQRRLAVDRLEHASSFVRSASKYWDDGGNRSDSMVELHLSNAREHLRKALELIQEPAS